MALSTVCPKCTSTSFEMTTKTKVKNCRHNVAFIQCSHCGCAISALSLRQDFILEEVAKKSNIR